MTYTSFDKKCLSITVNVFPYWNNKSIAVYRPKTDKGKFSPPHRHFKKNVIGLKDNEGETIFTSSAQAELLKNFYSSIFREDPYQLCLFQLSLCQCRSSQFLLCIEDSHVSISQKELVLMTFTRRWLSGWLIFWLNPCLNYSPIP